jgi:hypothetical protein
MSGSEVKGEGIGLNGPTVTVTGGTVGPGPGAGALGAFVVVTLTFFFLRYRLGPVLAAESLLKGLI